MTTDITCHPTPRIDLSILREPSKLNMRGSRAHTCHELRRACVSGRRLVHDEPLPKALRRLSVRGVHVGYVESRIDTLGILSQRNASIDPPATAYSECVPLVWWPLWGYNIGEFFQNSVLGIAELMAAGVVDREVMLAPEVGGWPLRDFHLHMLRAFTSHPVRTMAQLAPACPGHAQARAHKRTPPCRPAPRCFERLVLCRFRDVYDHQAPLAPWDAARRIVRSFRFPNRIGMVPSPGNAASSAAREYVVLFASRAHAKNGARLITNEAALIDRCNGWKPPERCVAMEVPRTARCHSRQFGRSGFRADVAAVQEADVLVGTHGAALVHAVFMRHGAALIEIRPYGFHGRWPDQYHYAMARRQNATHAFVIQTRDRTLCESTHTNGVPPANVSAWDARPLNTHVRLDAFSTALGAAACTSGRGDSTAEMRDRIPDDAREPFDYGALHSVVVNNGMI